MKEPCVISPPTLAFAFALLLVVLALALALRTGSAGLKRATGGFYGPAPVSGQGHRFLADHTFCPKRMRVLGEGQRKEAHPNLLAVRSGHHFGATLSDLGTPFPQNLPTKRGVEESLLAVLKQPAMSLSRTPSKQFGYPKLQKSSLPPSCPHTLPAPGHGNKIIIINVIKFVNEQWLSLKPLDSAAEKDRIRFAAAAMREAAEAHP